MAADLNTNQAQDTTNLDKCNPQQYIILIVGGAYTRVFCYNITKSMGGGDLLVLFKPLAGLLPTLTLMNHLTLFEKLSVIKKNRWRRDHVVLWGPRWWRK